MTFKELQDATLALMDEEGDTGTVLTNVKTFINSALLARATERKWSFMLSGDTTVSLGAGSSDLTLPADFGVLHYLKDPETGRLLVQLPQNERFEEPYIPEWDVSTLKGRGDFVLYGDTITLFTFVGPKDFTVKYYRVPARLVNDTDVPDFPEKWHELLIWDAVIGLKGYHGELENIEYLLERQRRLEQSLYVSNFKSDSVGAQPERVRLTRW